MIRRERKEKKEFRSLEEVQEFFLPSLMAHKKSESSAPRVIGVRLAREALAQLPQPLGVKKKPRKG